MSANRRGAARRGRATRRTASCRRAFRNTQPFALSLPARRVRRRQACPEHVEGLSPNGSCSMNAIRYRSYEKGSCLRPPSLGWRLKRLEKIDGVPLVSATCRGGRYHLQKVVQLLVRANAQSEVHFKVAIKKRAVYARHAWARRPKALKNIGAHPALNPSSQAVSVNPRRPRSRPTQRTPWPGLYRPVASSPLAQQEGGSRVSGSGGCAEPCSGGVPNPAQGRVPNLQIPRSSRVRTSCPACHSRCRCATDSPRAKVVWCRSSGRRNSTGSMS